MNTPPHGPYDPDPHSPYGQELHQRLHAQAGPEAEQPASGNRVTRAAASVFAELENAADAVTGGPPGAAHPPVAGQPHPSSPHAPQHSPHAAPAQPHPHSHLATEGKDFFERLDRGVREIAASTERATERRGFTLRRRPPAEGESPR